MAGVGGHEDQRATLREAAQVLEITAEAYRQRLSRARARLEGFVGATCGWANRDAPCTCERQLPAIRHLKAAGGAGRAAPIAIGMPAATTPLAPSMPTEKSAMCIEPPLPPQ